MEIDSDQIKTFNSRTAWNNVILEGFSIGMYHIVPRMVHLSRSQGNRDAGRHRHHIWEFNIILSGTMRFFWGEQSVTLQSGDVFFISPDTLHGWRLISPDFMILGLQTSISFPGGDPNFKLALAKAMDRVDHHSHGNPNIPVLASEIIGLMLNRKPFYREESRPRLQAIYVEIFKQLFPGGLEFETEQNNPEITMGLPGKRIAEILEYYVNDNMSREIKVSELCERFHISQCQLNRICRKETGMSPLKYVTSQKIGRAKFLLEKTECQIKEIAVITGYFNVNYFYRIFKKTTGMTPEEYRNKNR